MCSIHFVILKQILFYLQVHPKFRFSPLIVFQCRPRQTLIGSHSQNPGCPQKVIDFWHLTGNKINIFFWKIE